MVRCVRIKRSHVENTYGFFKKNLLKELIDFNVLEI